MLCFVKSSFSKIILLIKIYEINISNVSRSACFIGLLFLLSVAWLKLNAYDAYVLHFVPDFSMSDVSVFYLYR